MGGIGNAKFDLYSGKEDGTVRQEMCASAKRLLEKWGTDTQAVTFR